MEADISREPGLRPSSLRNESWTLSVIAGTTPIQISLLVAFSQLVPAHTVTLFRGIISLRVPRFPSSTSESWTYLRFYKLVFPDLDSSQPSSLRGDASETFAFAEFFPGPAKPIVSQFSNAVFDILVSLRICTPSRRPISQQRGVTTLTCSEVSPAAQGPRRSDAELSHSGL
ncbi:unnamed protein product [Parascedosporium putredinis]|uniref:Uncharacterized protein n=1 Tax=Parascedosporium putredinis TaxID=1442378 RepID=A0A9P1MD37_9PEZI|nr:unnamed protein product [Parascedosporium putredinis]CAI7999669.1 unnamed protein product [Parascedosporium putredinis]